MGTVERSTIGQGRTFPGELRIPPAVTDEDEDQKKKKVENAVKEAQQFCRDPNTIWTDGSRLVNGGVGGAIAWYEEIP